MTRSSKLPPPLVGVGLGLCLGLRTGNSTAGALHDAMHVARSVRHLDLDNMSSVQTTALLCSRHRYVEASFHHISRRLVRSRAEIVRRRVGVFVAICSTFEPGVHSNTARWCHRSFRLRPGGKTRSCHWVRTIRSRAWCFGRRRAHEFVVVESCGS